MSDCFVYIVAPKSVPTNERVPCKIGISASPNDRLKSLQTGSPVALRVHYQFRLRNQMFAYAVEQRVLRTNGDISLHGEWFLDRPNEAAEEVARHACELWMQQGLSYEEIADEVDRAGLASRILVRMIQARAEHGIYEAAA